MEKKHIEIYAPYLKIINNKKIIFTVKAKIPIVEKSNLIYKEDCYFYDESFFSTAVVDAQIFKNEKSAFEYAKKIYHPIKKKLFISSVDNYFNFHGSDVIYQLDPNFNSLSIETQEFSTPENFKAMKKINLYFELDEFRKKIERNFKIFGSVDSKMEIYMKTHGYIYTGEYSKYFINLELLDLSKSEFFKKHTNACIKYKPIDGPQPFLLFKDSRDYNTHKEKINEKLKAISKEFNESDFFKKYFIKNKLEKRHIHFLIKTMDSAGDSIVFNEDMIEPHPPYYQNLMSKTKTISQELDKIIELIKSQNNNVFDNFKII